MEKKLLKIVLLTDADCGQAWPDISPCLQDGAVIIARLELTGLPDRESGGNLLFKLYQILDLALSRPPAKSARISRRSVKPNDLKLKLRELGADCLVWLSDYPLPLDLAEILPLGVLCFDPLGDSRGARRFFRAMASQKTSLATRLLHVEAGRTRELGRAATGLEPLSLARNLAQARSKVGGLAARALRLLLHKDLDEPLEAAVAESEPYTLSLALSLKFLLSLACFGLGDLWRNLFYRKQWFLAWRPQSTGAPWDNPQKFQPLYPPHGLGRADPFIFEKDGETFILYEEIPESTRRGVLGAAGTPGHLHELGEQAFAGTKVR